MSPLAGAEPSITHALQRVSSTRTGPRPFTKVSSHFTIRPEVRYDWFNGVTSGGVLPYNDGTSSHQLLFGVDLIAQF